MHSAIDEAYRRFPDVVEPITEHPAGKITVDRGDLRYAFIEGARFSTQMDRIAEKAKEALIGVSNQAEFLDMPKYIRQLVENALNSFDASSAALWRDACIFPVPQERS